MKKLALSLLLLSMTWLSQAAVYSIKKYGAKQGKMATEAIQKALDAAGEAGGGVVVVPAGTWNTGTIWLRSHVELRLEKGAVLKGSTNKEDYNRDDAFPENFGAPAEEWSGAHLVIGYRVEDVAITGEGVIDGSGPAFFGECDEDSRFPWYKYGLKLHPIDRSWFRPGPMVAIFLSKNIRMEGVTLKDTPCWTTHFRACEGVDIRNVTIDADRTIANSDGFSIDCTRDVVVDGCTIRTGDDGFAIRACYRYNCVADDYPCENIRVTNCDVWSCCYAARIGIGTGIVRDVEIKDCRFHESSFGIGFCPAWTPGERGVYIENIRIKNCDVLQCARPVESDALADNWRLKDITFEDCRFESLEPILFRSNSLRRPENITFRNCTRKHLDALKVRHHLGWGGERSRKFIADCDVANLKIENCWPAEGQGLLVLSFDDRNFNDWIEAMPLFEKYNAHATFFVSGPIDGEAVRTMKRLYEAGHSVGLHGLNHLKADEALAEKGGALFYKEEIEPQLYACQVAYIPITCYSYPYCRVSDDADKLFKEWGFSHVRGAHVQVNTPGTSLAEIGSSVPFRIDSAFAGEEYNTDIEEIKACIRRAAEQKEVFVLSSHGISPDAKGNNMKTEWLEEILSTAKECGLRAVGFDELL